MIHKGIYLSAKYMTSSIFFDRINVWKETKELSNNYLPPPKSIKYTFDPTFNMDKKYETTRLEIINKDTIDSAIDEINEGYNPLVLNLADDCLPGGCIDYGSGAQEESLFRRSNYWQTLDITHYPILFNEAVYSPNVTVFRSNEKTNWKILSKPIKIDFIACPGIKFPVMKNNMLNEEDIKILEDKIQLICQVAYKSSHDCLILGALGCGAWKNPPEHVAQIFRYKIMENLGIFKKIVFPILKTDNDTYILKSSRPDNYNIFVNEFSK